MYARGQIRISNETSPYGGELQIPNKTSIYGAAKYIGIFLSKIARNALMLQQTNFYVGVVEGKINVLFLGVVISNLDIINFTR